MSLTDTAACHHDSKVTLWILPPSTRTTARHCAYHAERSHVILRTTDKHRSITPCAVRLRHGGRARRLLCASGEQCLAGRPLRVARSHLRPRGRDLPHRLGQRTSPSCQLASRHLLTGLGAASAAHSFTKAAEVILTSAYFRNGELASGCPTAASFVWSRKWRQGRCHVHYRHLPDSISRARETRVEPAMILRRRVDDKPELWPIWRENGSNN